MAEASVELGAAGRPRCQGRIGARARAGRATAWLSPGAPLYIM
jgi:hypothetical protein